MIQAMYEDFWIRYAEYLTDVDMHDRAENVYMRGVYTFIPESSPKMLIAYANYLSSLGRFDEARALYVDATTKRPGQLQTLINYAQFERRALNDANMEITILKDGLSKMAKEHLPFLYCAIAKTYSNVLKDNEEARQTFIEGCSANPNDRYLILSFFRFESHVIDSSAIDRMKTIFGYLKDSSLVLAEKKRFVEMFVEFLLSTDLPVSDITSFQKECFAGLRSLKITPPMKRVEKRPFDAYANGEAVPQQPLKHQ
jgi:pre-mRNA-processing factor 39